MGISDARGSSQPSYAPPVPISADHRLDRFDCGKPPLDDWLRAHARDSEHKASRSYAVTALAGEEADQVVAYYALAYGGVVRTEVPKKIRRGLPNPVLVMVLGRLEVDRHLIGRGSDRPCSARRCSAPSRPPGSRA